MGLDFEHVTLWIYAKQASSPLQKAFVKDYAISVLNVDRVKTELCRSYKRN